LVRGYNAGRAGYLRCCSCTPCPQCTAALIHTHKNICILLSLTHSLTHAILTHSRTHSLGSYFIPEDGDSELQPNVFLAPKPRQPGYPPTLGQIKQALPVPGRYHFRFKSPLVPGADRDKTSMAVWMDCVDDRQAVPVWRSTIVAKLTRIGVEEDDDDDDELLAEATSRTHATPRTASAPTTVSHGTAQSGHAPPPPSHTTTSSTTSTTTTNTQRHPSTPGFDLFDAAPPTTPHVSSGDFLDMHYGAPATASQSHQPHDFLGMHTPGPPVANHGTANSGFPPPAHQQSFGSTSQPSQTSGPFF
jgi:hypothetical protein